MPNETLESDLVQIADVVKITPSFMRSVNVERDIDAAGALDGYIPTAKAMEALRRIVGGAQGSSGTRAWTITGPYGSGKSAFALFLASLLGKPNPARARIRKILEGVDRALADDLSKLAGGPMRGFLTIPISGIRAPIASCVVQGIRRAVEAMHLGTDGRAEVIAEIEACRSVAEPSADQVIRLLSHVQQTLEPTDSGYSGVLVIVDELGKLLEYASNNPAQSDTFVFQEIAELADRSSAVPVIFVGILHQAFENYMVNADQETEREWAKVQGRFEDIAFREPADQVMRLIAKAVQIQAAFQQRIYPELASVGARALVCGLCPPGLDKDEFVSLSCQAYPLHPSVLASLPYLFERFSQNERSVFAYLSAHEPHGFQQFIHAERFDPEKPRYVRLPSVFDYLVANFSSSVRSTWNGRRIRVALDALDRAPELDTVQVDSVKAIGLLDTLSAISHVRADVGTLGYSLLDGSTVTTRELLGSLESRSLVTFRKYSDSYVIWDGSDVDVEARLREARNHVSQRFSLAEAAAENLGNPRLVGSRHSYETGTMRCFEVKFSDDLSSVNTAVSGGSASGTILLCLPRTEADLARFVQQAGIPPISARDDILVAIPRRVPKLRRVLHDIRCLSWVVENTPEIRGDSVARREIRERTAELKNSAAEQLGGLVNPRNWSSDTFRWFYHGSEVVVGRKGGISALLSAVLDSVYSLSPQLWNELVNRHVVSSTVAAARKSLIEAMFIRGEQARLGIEGYPPEISIYYSVLHRSGIHREVQPGQWSFGAPLDGDETHLTESWRKMTELIFSSSPEPEPVQHLMAVLREPPFGMTEGVFPIVLCAFVLAHKDEVSTYREGTFVPDWTLAHWELLVRRPDMFSVKGFKLVGARSVILNRLSELLGTPQDLLPVVRAIVRRLGNLAPFVRQTRRLSAAAAAVRNAVLTARGPEQLLFHEIPGALGITSFDEQGQDPGAADDFCRKLESVLRELTGAMNLVADEARDYLLETCGFPVGPAGFEQLRVSARSIYEYGISPELGPFLSRLGVGTGGDTAALDSALAYVAGTPVRLWSDATVQQFRSQAERIGRVFTVARARAVAQVGVVGLSEEESRQSELLATRIQSSLAQVSAEVSPKVIRVALLRLFRILDGMSSEGGR